MRHDDVRPGRIFYTFAFVAVLFWASAVYAQTQTTAFSYQGKLTDGGNPANANYDLQFALFDNSSGGTQIGSTLTRSSVAVSGGVFTVQLDFGVSAFPGANRFLEIGVRPNGGGSFTMLAPRQQISSTPYAIRTLNAGTADALSSACVACVQDSQINQVAGSKVNGTIPVASVPGGSTSYIQSNPLTQQSGATFNISGDGTAGTLNGNVVNTTTQYNLGGKRILSSDASLSLFVGLGAGQANTLGSFNAFFGVSAGYANTMGFDNGFFGSGAGVNNTIGRHNNFFGDSTGLSTTEGSDNTFMGDIAGKTNTIGGMNTIIGADADVGQNNLSNATAIGARALVSQSNSLVLGSIAGVNGATADTLVGIGTASPSSKLDIAAQDGLRIRGFQPFLTLTDTNASDARGRIASGNGDLSFYPESSLASGVASMTVKNTGNVGIGTASPMAARLVVKDTNVGTAIDGTTSTNGSGVFGESTGGSGYGVYGNSPNGGYAIYANGNTGQAINSGGFVKAMLLMNANGGINLCYNSQVTGVFATTPLCGFDVVHQLDTGVYDITFPFQVNSRFFSATTAFTNGNTTFNGSPFLIGVRPTNPQVVRVQITNYVGTLTDCAFYLIVF